MNSVCRSWNGQYLVTGDDDQKVNLFSFPVVAKKQVRKDFIGHSSHVCRLRFTPDDNYLVSVGGNDKSILVWRTDFGNKDTLEKGGAGGAAGGEAEEEVDHGDVGTL